MSEPKNSFICDGGGGGKNVETVNNAALKAVLHLTIMLPVWEVLMLPEKHILNIGKMVVHIIFSLFGGPASLDWLLATRSWEAFRWSRAGRSAAACWSCLNAVNLSKFLAWYLEHSGPKKSASVKEMLVRHTSTDVAGSLFVLQAFRCSLKTRYPRWRVLFPEEH